MKRKNWGRGESSRERCALATVDDVGAETKWKELGCLREALSREVSRRAQECNQALALLERKKMVLRGLEAQLKGDQGNSAV